MGRDLTKCSQSDNFYLIMKKAKVGYENLMNLIQIELSSNLNYQKYLI